MSFPALNVLTQGIRSTSISGGTGGGSSGGGAGPVLTNAVHYWTMDDADLSGSTVTNLGTSGTVLTLVGSPTTGVNGQVGQAVDFDRFSGQYAALPASVMTSLTDFSISVWFNTSWTSSAQALFDYYKVESGNVEGLTIQMDALGEIGVVTGDGTGSVLGTDYWALASQAGLNDGNNHHMVLSYDVGSTTMKLYIDAVLVSSDATVSGIGWPTDSGMIPTFASILGGFPLLTGSLDEIKIFDYDLTAAQVLDIFIQDGGVLGTVAPTDMIGHYTMDTVHLAGATMDNQGSTGATNDMTLVGSPTTGQTGQVRESVLFSSSSEHATIPATLLASATSFGIGGWFKRAAIASTGTLASNQFNIAGAIGGLRVIVSSAGNISFSVSDNTGSVEGTDIWTLDGTTTGLDDSTFHSWFVSYDLATTTMKVYVSGQLESTRTDATSSVFIGGIALFTSRDTSGLNPIVGNQDNLRVFNYAPTNAQVLALHQLDGGL